MWNKLLDYLRHLLLHKEQTEKNTSDLKKVKQDVEEMTLIMQRFGLELSHLQQIEASEREKLTLRLENVLLRQRSLPPGASASETNNEQLTRLLEELKHENEELRLRVQQLEQRD